MPEKEYINYVENLFYTEQPLFTQIMNLPFENKSSLIFAHYIMEIMVGEKDIVCPSARIKCLLTQLYYSLKYSLINGVQ